MVYDQVSCHRDKGSEKVRSGLKGDNGQVSKPQDNPQDKSESPAVDSKSRRSSQRANTALKQGLKR
jgi:hypothetical protein